MAYIDKIYGTKKQWKQLRDYLIKNNLAHWTEQMSTNPCSKGEVVIANFYKFQDIYLIQNCPLDFVQNRLKEQYSKDYDIHRKQIDLK